MGFTVEYIMWQGQVIGGTKFVPATPPASHDAAPCAKPPPVSPPPSVAPPVLSPPAALTDLALIARLAQQAALDFPPPPALVSLKTLTFDEDSAILAAQH